MVDFKPVHGPLPVVGETVLPFREAPYQLITFLNKTLKRRGLIFGLKAVDDGTYLISVYDWRQAEAAENIPAGSE